YKSVNALGSFILIDKLTNLTVGAGVINHALRKSSNVIWEKTDIRRKDRSNLLGYNSKVLWFTGLSGSGKSTLTNILEKKLHEKGILTYILDGDNLRHGLNRDLGFNENDRIENIRRVGEVAKLMHDSGVYVLASFISPYLLDRENIRQLFDRNNFIEVYVKCDLETLKNRDPKGLYSKAFAGEIPNFTGVSSKYEEPINPEIVIDTAKIEADAGVEQIMNYLNKNGLF
ncbi:MAG: adenylyl-sulfate kinase, partial [Gammaproteobacteria bacterium]